MGFVEGGLVYVITSLYIQYIIIILIENNMIRKTKLTVRVSLKDLFCINLLSNFLVQNYLLEIIQQFIILIDAFKKVITC